MLRRPYHFDIKEMSAYCEANYSILCQILPEILSDDDASDNEFPKKKITIDRGNNVPSEIAFVISEQCPYTTMIDINLEMNFSEGYIGALSNNNLSVRLYHDVKMAEVISFNYCYNRLSTLSFANESMQQPDEKVQQNKLLFEWLSLCLKDGILKFDLKSELGLFLRETADKVNSDSDKKIELQ